MSSIYNDLRTQFRVGDVTTKLIFWNVALFVIPFMLFAIFSLFSIDLGIMNYVSLSSDLRDLAWKPWSPLTYMFFHAGIFHLLFNMLMLNFSGRLFHTFFTQKQMLGVYLLGGIVAGIVYILCYMFFPALVSINTSLVGASAAIMAVLFATVTYSPQMEIRLMLFGNVRLWHIASVLVIIDLLQLQAENTGGHLAHLAGAFFGYIYTGQLKSGRDIAGWIGNLLDFSPKKQKTPFRKVHKNYRPAEKKPVSKIVTKDKTQQQIDEILDKISRSGYDSLTAAEKDFLFRAGKQ